MSQFDRYAALIDRHLAETGQMPTPGGEAAIERPREMIVPIPPSTNHLFATVRGRRVKSAKYRKWTEEAVNALQYFRWNGEYPCRVTLTICEKIFAQRDLDNAIKPVLDAMVAAKVIEDDNVRHVKAVTVEYRPGTGDGVRIEIH